MLKTRAVILSFGVLSLVLGIGALDITMEVVMLKLHGTRTSARVTEIYQQNMDEAGGWFMSYEYAVRGRTYAGSARAHRDSREGGDVPIVFLPYSPAISNTVSEVRLGAILGPLGLFPVGLVLAGTGIWLLFKGTFASKAELRRKTEEGNEQRT